MDNTAESDLIWSGKNPDPATSRAPWRIYNIGNSKAIALMRFIQAIEQALEREAIKKLLSIPLGDVPVCRH